LGLSGRIPRRVDAATKAGVLKLIDRATAAGWEHRRACAYLELGEARAWRWRERRAVGCLQDRPAGGHAVHGLLDAEHDAIIALYDDWSEIDRSHRKLAHRGSYERRVWVSPSTVMRVLAAHGLILRAPHRAGRSERRPFPEWASYEKNSIWIYDCTHFAGCPGVAVTTVMDLVTRKCLRGRLRRADQHAGPGRVHRRARARRTTRARRGPSGPRRCRRRFPPRCAVGPDPLGRQ
jgi:putative transposase